MLVVSTVVVGSFAFAVVVVVVVVGSFVVSVVVGWGGCEDLHPACNKTNDKANLNGS